MSTVPNFLFKSGYAYTVHVPPPKYRTRRWQAQVSTAPLCQWWECLISRLGNRHSGNNASNFELLHYCTYSSTVDSCFKFEGVEVPTWWDFTSLVPEQQPQFIPDRPRIRKTVKYCQSWVHFPLHSITIISTEHVCQSPDVCFVLHKLAWIVKSESSKVSIEGKGKIKRYLMVDVSSTLVFLAFITYDYHPATPTL